MAVQGFETTGGTPDEFRQYIAKETAKWGPLVLAAGMKPE
jgi:tripartite-type tricarboxylate transporter receptor subunit TctC